MVTRPVIDEFFTLSDDQLLERIRGIDDALLSPDQSGSSKDVGSYTNKTPAELERMKTKMTRCYALRTGQQPLPRPGGGVKYHRVFVRKDY